MNTHKLRQKIAETCPEIMELGFGCEIKDIGDLGTGNWKFLMRHDESNRYMVFRETSGMGWGNPFDFEIIGHPVRLSHVLRAMLEYEKRNLVVTVYTSGEIQKYQYLTNAKELLSKWDLTKDFEDQSEETQRFVASLLNVEID